MLSFITLQNFRCFERLELELDPRCTVLFAKSGRGKSAVVDALRMALAVVPSHDPKPAPELTDLRWETATRGGGWARTYPSPLLMVEAQSAAPNGLRWTHRFERGAQAKLTNHKTMEQALKQPAPGADRPVIAVYGAQRRWAGSEAREPGGDPLDGYQGCLHAGDSPAALRGWWRHRDHIGSKAGAPRDPALQAVSAAVQRFCGEGAEPPEYDPNEDDISLHLPGLNGRFLLRELSDGYRDLLSIVGDVARRAATLNPDGDWGPERLREVKGLVVIDELDLHLHPRLQRQVLPTLLDTFEALQFVITTHSPLVLSSERHRARVYELAEGEATPPRARQTQGRDVASIVREMGSEVRPDWARAELVALYELIDARQLTAARERFEALQREWLTRDDIEHEHVLLALEWAEAEAEGEDDDAKSSEARAPR